MQPTEDILVLKKINKAFPGVKALTDMDFSLRRARSTPWWAKTARANPP